VVQYCPIKGCGETVRKGTAKQHLEANLARHFILLKKERENILWRGSEAVSFFEGIWETVQTSEVISLTLATETKLTNQTKQGQ